MLWSEEPIEGWEPLLERLDAWKGWLTLNNGSHGVPILTHNQAEEIASVMIEARDGIRLLLKDGEELLEGYQKTRSNT